MSKMSKPEMDVVRFKENDIIVASGGGLPNFIKITGFNDTIADNGTVEYNGVIYNKSTYSDLIDCLIDNTPFDENVNYQGMAQSITRLFRKNDGTTAAGFGDGTYTWDASLDAFKQ